MRHVFAILFGGAWGAFANAMGHPVFASFADAAMTIIPAGAIGCAVILSAKMAAGESL